MEPAGDDRTIIELLAQPEGMQLAFVRGKFRPDELAETLAALANAQGGTVLLGVAGHGKKVEGVGDVEGARAAVLDAALACTPPLVLPMPRAVRAGAAALLLVSVPAGLPRVYSVHGKYLRRAGAQDQPIPPDALRRLLLERGETSWERLIPEGATLDDLDDEAIAAYARRIGPAAEGDPLAFLFRRGCLARPTNDQRPTTNDQRSAESTLGSDDHAVAAAAPNTQHPTPLTRNVGRFTTETTETTEEEGGRIVVPADHSLMPHPPSPIPHPPSPNTQHPTPNTQHPYIPTNAGLLLFGRDVERFFPQCEITLVRYRGREMSDEFLREDVRDRLVESVRRAEIWLSEHMRRGSRMVGLEREDWVQFPQGAVREALVNAVAHRDYTSRGEGIRIALFADRLECYSPGRLPGHVTLQNLVEERFSRNETLVQVLADYGLIERLGYGIDRMMRQMAEAGLPMPEFRETAAGFLVTLRGRVGDDRHDVGGIDTSEWQRMGLNERQIAALLHLTEQRRITNRDMQELAPDVSPETLRRDLADLVERGLLLRVGEKRGAYYILK